jgi:transcriptional regulator with XRE-family HTH domain
MMIQEKVGKRIKELRNKLDISQEELGFRSGVHRTYIASLEVGKRNISIVTLEKITDALEISLSNFFDF